VLYAIVGAFHFIFRDKFLMISLEPETAEASGVSVRFWDFLFYTSFGLVVTSSAEIAGSFSPGEDVRSRFGWAPGIPSPSSTPRKVSGSLRSSR